MIAEPRTEFAVRVHYYAQLREQLGFREENVLLHLPASEQDILEQLAVIHPQASSIFLCSRIAVEDNYFAADHIFAKLTELDIISPISGG